MVGVPKSRVVATPEEDEAMRTYVLRPIEVLAEVIHPMAAVAWDRDCSGVELWSSKFSELRHLPLRFSTHRDNWVAITGNYGCEVAHWDAAGECWVPTWPAGAEEE